MKVSAESIDPNEKDFYVNGKIIKNNLSSLYNVELEL
jgi:hypothetical protein